NTLSSYGRDIIDAITLIILTPFIIQMLGREQFGLWSLLWAFLNLLTLIDMGFGNSVVKFVADAKGKGDMNRQQSIIATLFWIYVGLGGVLMLCVLGGMLFFNQIFNIPPEYHEKARMVLVILGLRSALTMPFGMFRGVLIGHQKMKVANGYKILAALAYFVSVLIFLRWIPSLRMLALLNMVGGVAPMVAMLVHAKATLPGISLHPKFFNRSVVKEVSSFSMYFMLIHVSTLIATKVDAMIIQTFMMLEMVAVYTIAMRLSEKGQQFCFQLVKTLTPVVAELHGAGDHENIRAVWQRGTKITVAFAAPLLIGLILLAEPLIRAWVGSEFEEDQIMLATYACRWLAGAAMVMVIHGNTANILSMQGHQKFLAFSLIGGQLLNLALTITMIGPLGLEGVAMATLISAGISQLFIQHRAGKIHNYSLGKFYQQTLIPCIVPVVLMALAFHVVQTFYTLTNLFEVAMLEIIGVMLFALVFWFIGFTENERDYFKKRILRKLSHKKRS
ncbi:MAG: flippase, partial [Candidatus Electryoneaceae bacterium]|nr:flippase [Candidatus Electryoneaceae bacterium]